MDIIGMTLEGFYSCLWPLSSRYSDVELWRQLALEGEMSGGNAMKKQPGCEHQDCNFWERCKLQQTLDVIPLSYQSLVVL